MAAVTLSGVVEAVAAAIDTAHGASGWRRIPYVPGLVDEQPDRFAHATYAVEVSGWQYTDPARPRGGAARRGSVTLAVWLVWRIAADDAAGSYAAGLAAAEALIETVIGTDGALVKGTITPEAGGPIRRMYDETFLVIPLRFQLRTLLGG